MQASPTARALCQRFVDLWWECDAGEVLLGRAYTPREQAAREGHLERYLAALDAELKRRPRSVAERRAARERIADLSADFARSALDFEPRQLDVVQSHGFAEAATDLARAARRFDPAISAEDIFQAARNAATMYSLQLLVGVPVRLTPAVLAYSLLYPYSDNYLDDPGVDAAARLAFNERFRRRLVGEQVTPTDARERRVFDLVAMLEAELDLARHPAVFESLLAIHEAQGQSLRLLRPGAPPYDVDVLGIGFAKGGASVLADGYLVAGELTEGQAEAAFGWGILLQLVDDLDDVERDGARGLQTIFSQTARRWPLDALTDRTLRFALGVLGMLDRFDSPDSGPFRGLIARSASLMLVDAAGKAARLYTPGYIQALEAHSPFRFSFLRKVREKLARRRMAPATLVEAFLAPDLLAPDQDDVGLS